jgi:phosphopantothenoylcysteine decarboxylase/phosphopantothenate--cysteine ligase
MKKTRQAILGVSASIAIYKSCEIIRRLKAQSCEVSVIMTEDSLRFIQPFLFESLSGRKTHYSLFEEPVSWEIEHVTLADKADIVLIAPATANIIAKIANGLCDDLLSCVVSATKAPVLICPAMNENMYTNKITQANIGKLQSLGHHFVEPKKGMLACGKEGMGCLADIDTIVKQALMLMAA